MIKISGEVVEKIAISTYDDNDDNDYSNVPEEYKGWYVIADEETGDYDSSKGSMVDFEMDLYNAEDEHLGTCIGGYYNGTSGYQFSDEFYEFEIVEETPESLFNSFLIDLAEDEDLSINRKMYLVKNYK